MDLLFYLFCHKNEVDVERVYRMSEGAKAVLWALASHENDLRGE